ncbi:MAG TPA: helix-turn-helix domain-containing protein [Candidatus Limnocylindria bacterium]|nr:helix-turn-helix domain-containing protein [Candidatus Limnocylindria bacterium]
MTAGRVVPGNIAQVDYRRVGATFRAVRIKKGWRQEDLALRAGVSRAAVSRVESGRVGGLSLDHLLGIAGALDVRLELGVRWHGGELDRLMNSRHSALHEATARYFAELPGWIIAPEVTFAVFGERGAIDILAWQPATRALLVIELKTEIVDVNELMSTLDRKSRLAPRIARERGWDPRVIGTWLIVAEGSTNRRRVRSHSTTLRAALLAGGHEIVDWMRKPVKPIAALSFWSNARKTNAKSGFATVKRVRRLSPKAA